MVELAIEMANELGAFREENNLDIDFRIGINSGAVIGAIIGKTKFHYDVWGDAVNLAARMESQGVPGRIQITAQTKALLAISSSMNLAARLI
jgi:adenylate cyclase